MNWTAIASAAALISALVNLGVFLRIAFYAGQLVQKVENCERRLMTLETINEVKSRESREFAHA